MKKIVVAGIALLVAGTAAFAAVRIGVYGVCPLTGKPIHCSKSVCPPTPDCPLGSELCTESRVAANSGANASADAMAAPQTVSVPSAQCAQTRRHCCCKEQAQVERQPAPAPASEPATRP
jgi:hypothetical protein